MKIKVWLVIGAWIGMVQMGYAKDPLEGVQPDNQRRWVDSVFQSMSLDQKIGQLFMIAAFSNKDEKHQKEIEKLIQDHHLGGLIFFQGGPIRQAVLTNRYQSLAKIPLMIGMDAEWGISMRLDSVPQFPKQMALGAIADDNRIYQMGAEIARQCKELGVHINFAPVVDVNSNPLNPVIGYRSFGENKENVTRKGVAYMKGLQDNGVLANAKHFPGHGDSESDSHYTLPTIKHDLNTLTDIDLYPFRKLMEENLMSVMVAHLFVPSLDAEPNKATTLSKAVVTDLLKNQMKFEGLIFTDALNMKGVANYYSPGQVDVMALLAGNDILLYSEDVPKAVTEIKNALDSGLLLESQIDESVKKILKAKYWAGLHDYQPIVTEGLYQRLNLPQSQMLIEDLYARAFTTVRDEPGLLPFTNLDLHTFASLSINSEIGQNTFKESLSNYAPFAHYDLAKTTTRSDSVYYDLTQKLSSYNTVVVGLHGVISNTNRGHGIKPEDIKFLEQLAEKTNVVLVVFGNAYSLQYFDKIPSLTCIYEENPTTLALAPQMLFGARASQGALPVTASTKAQSEQQIFGPNLGRLSYGAPESVGLDGEKLKEIDYLIDDAVARKVFPGAQVLVAKNGKVVYQKAFGYQTYDKLEPVTNETIYDIASITKVAGTMQTVMFLVDNDALDLEETLGHYLPELKKTNKGKIKIKDVLTHEAGLQPYIPYFTQTLIESQLDSNYYSKMPEHGYTTEVATGLYGVSSLPDSVWKWTIESDLRKLPKGKKHYDYKYSDMGYYILKKICEQILNQPMEDFLQQNFYQPLGLSTMTYLPLCKFPEERISPTELDSTFRKMLLRGHVHDPGAAMFGGIAGHAGLFSNANDLAILMQMNLQGGSYGAQQILSPRVIRQFTKKQKEGNRRGLGWDKPDYEMEEGPTSKLASPETFGHTGFTGTAVWVDPEHDLIYVFLSNRVYPDANNNLISKENIRPKIHHILYESMASFDKKYRAN